MDKNTEIYYGIRGDEFKFFIKNLIINSSKLKNDSIKLITNDENMKLFEMCFTHFSVDKESNYEAYEFIGDSTINKCVTMYLFEKYPQLNNCGGIKYLTRLKITLICKKNLANYANKLGFEPYISVIKYNKNPKMLESLLEDTFEAFIGCLESVINNTFNVSVGYEIAKQFITKLLDETELPPITYEGLWDPKSRLKELFDYTDNINSLTYSTDKHTTVENDIKIHTFNTTVFGTITSSDNNVNKQIEIGKGSGTTKLKSEHNAAENSLTFLKSMGVFKKVDSEHTSM